MGIVDKLTPHPPVPESGTGVAQAKAPEPKPALTNAEGLLLARSTTFIVAAMARHGIQLAPREAPWAGAEVADFVLSEFEKAKADEKEAQVAKKKAKADE